jgi:8-oxo-dGTP diphosphatase
MSSRRVYPKKPLVGVGILIRQGDKYLLIQRAAEPDKGLWSVPGGMIEIGERSTEAAVREVYEETGLVVEILRILDVIDKIIMDENKVKFHFVIVDFDWALNDRKTAN